MSERRILCIGLCCVDVVMVCNRFPKEDSDQRCLEYYWQRGGNASNSASVLAMLGADVEFMGVLVNGPEFGFLKKDFNRFGIRIDNCVLLDDGRDHCSISTVVINKENGSRTIVAGPRRTELKFEDFDRKIKLQNYKWIHFEGRPNKFEMAKMIRKILEFNKNLPDDEKITISLELEKAREPDIVDLIQYVDYTFVSKEFATTLGYKSKEYTVDKFVNIAKPGSSVVCPWGEDGAAARCGSREIVTSSIFPPEDLVETLAAGDTFNAGAIYAVTEGKNLKDTITFGCKVAGAKCGMAGIHGLEGFQGNL